MIIEQLPAILKEALPILQKIKQAGFEAYFVGGCVRDTLLNKPLHDIDLATNAYPQELKQIFTHTVDTGIEHGTVTVVTAKQNYEITTFRTETGYQDYRRPDHVEFVRSLAEDLKRRDFTINALAMDLDGRIIDLFGGVADLKSHRIKAVGQAQERFHEDALRMMRAVRFQAQLGFTIVPSTLKGITENASLLKKIAIERISDEWLRMMCGDNWQLGLQSMLTTKLYKYCPQFTEQDFTKLLQVSLTRLQNASQVWTLLGLVWNLPLNSLNRLLRTWKVSNEVRHLTLMSVRFLRQSKPTDWDLYQTEGATIDNCVQLLQVLQKNVVAQQLQKRYSLLPIHSLQDVKINGQQIMQQLNLTPGPQIGANLRLVQQQIVANKLANEPVAIINYLRAQQ
ncbi:CCA tRNA nucleotidyltransferase [Bombilactobacillus thymidiniphilus]|uniref:CCA-adding enzyme n=1 Tax=Bombilactobacillus thymidiniphilus TaxID=2923363 RepID=A0ABY4PF10_9LACO|nr:CCA tRNA nucleotidyltransferase [Bombilactobacillus thymidiniphilus]UQS84394.1 CCA tRNA nucleotidyltransferase [Bombilactobacillus thymidiniphilus]